MSRRQATRAVTGPSGESTLPEQAELGLVDDERAPSKGYIGTFDLSKPLLIGFKGFRVVVPHEARRGGKWA